MESQRRDEALKYYSAALFIHPTNTQHFFILQSKVGVAKESWKDALDHANEASSIVSRKSSHVNTDPSGDSTQSIITIGPRGETCGFACGRTI